MGKIRNENYIVIQGFMVNELQLKGNELLIYAIIYGFSQEEGQVFSGSLQYLSDWTNITKQSVINCLKSLLDKGYIIKRDKIINNVKFVEYYSKNFNRVVKIFEWGSQKTLMGGSQKILTNNIILNNIEDNIDNNISSYYLEKQFGRTIAPLEYEKIKQWEETFTDDVINYAIDKAVLNNIKTFNYIEGILRNWKTCNYKTLQEIKENESKKFLKEKEITKFEDIEDYNWLEEE